MNKKLIIAVGLAVLSAGVFAGPHRGGRGPGFHHRGGMRCAPRHHHHRPSAWGRAGRHFWPGFAGGVIGGIVGRSIVSPCYATTTVVASPAVVTTPAVVAPSVVVTTPAVVTQPSVATVGNVWVEGRYVDQVQSDGTVVRVWQPGHYEQRTVIAP